jgi:large conductance mechanosensitive channel
MEADMGKADLQVMEKRIAEGEELERKTRIKRHREKIKKERESFWNDFKKFVSRGNVLDLAVAVVIANSFNAIVSGLVKYVITPCVTYFTSGVSIHEWEYVMKEELLDEAGEVIQAEIAIQYGLWIQTIIDFLIIAFSIFVAVRLVNNARKKIVTKEEARAAEEAKKKKADEEKAAKKAKKEADAKAAALAAREEEFYSNVKKQSALLEDIKNILSEKK